MIILTWPGDKHEGNDDNYIGKEGRKAGKRERQWKRLRLSMLAANHRNSKLKPIQSLCQSLI